MVAGDMPMIVIWWKEKKSMKKEKDPQQNY